MSGPRARSSAARTHACAHPACLHYPLHAKSYTYGSLGPCSGAPLLSPRGPRHVRCHVYPYPRSRLVLVLLISLVRYILLTLYFRPVPGTANLVPFQRTASVDSPDATQALVAAETPREQQQRQDPRNAPTRSPPRKPSALPMRCAMSMRRGGCLLSSDAEARSFSR